MRRTLFVVAAAMALAFCLSPNASATELQLNDPGVVGILNGDNTANPPETETLWAQHLLDMAASTTDPNYTPGSGYKTSSTEYQGTLTYVDKIGGGGLVVPSGYLYAFAKYDGKNAGYVLFYLPTWGSNTIPEYSYSIWGANSGQYQISHFLYFNSVPVPDGGSMVMLLGIGLMGLAGVRRMLT